MGTSWEHCESDQLFQVMQGICVTAACPASNASQLLLHACVSPHSCINCRIHSYPLMHANFFLVIRLIYYLTGSLYATTCHVYATDMVSHHTSVVAFDRMTLK